MKTKQHKDVYFELNPVIAEAFLANSEEIRASGLKTSKDGKKAYVFIREGFLAEALELNRILWERKSLEASTNRAA